MQCGQLEEVVELGASEDQAEGVVGEVSGRREESGGERDHRETTVPLAGDFPGVADVNAGA